MEQPDGCRVGRRFRPDPDAGRKNARLVRGQPVFAQLAVPAAAASRNPSGGGVRCPTGLM
jgi:hypothetical protein